MVVEVHVNLLVVSLSRFQYSSRVSGAFAALHEHARVRFIHVHYNQALFAAQHAVGGGLVAPLGTAHGRRPPRSGSDRPVDQSS